MPPDLDLTVAVNFGLSSPRTDYATLYRHANQSLVRPQAAHSHILEGAVLVEWPQGLVFRNCCQEVIVLCFRFSLVTFLAAAGTTLTLWLLEYKLCCWIGYLEGTGHKFLERLVINIEERLGLESFFHNTSYNMLSIRQNLGDLEDRVLHESETTVSLFESLSNSTTSLILAVL